MAVIGKKKNKKKLEKWVKRSWEWNPTTWVKHNTEKNSHV